MGTLADNVTLLGHKTAAAMRYQQSVDAAGARMAASLSVNALAERATATEKTGPSSVVVTA